MNKRKYGQIIISKSPIVNIEEFAPVPFPERVLSCSIQDYEVHTTHVPPGHRMELLKLNTLKVCINFYHKGMLRM